ncbi:hypothetical protein [Mesorhizobium sp. SARCC-RB16n]|uniref:hypothetical protein n=1 Tax=Mesorhizobium sp. SARCC-RB16n TaxID=2116687 RepID=UPI00166C54CD|nr:hypothetical protein [Mesorhizobium sp. SARCC-RB16n]
MRSAEPTSAARLAAQSRALDYPVMMTPVRSYKYATTMVVMTMPPVLSVVVLVIVVLTVVLTIAVAVLIVMPMVAVVLIPIAR